MKGEAMKAMNLTLTPPALLMRSSLAENWFRISEDMKVKVLKKYVLNEYKHLYIYISVLWLLLIV
jgi:hypothetical protein